MLVIIINLQRSIDRKNYMISQMNKYQNVNYVFFNAIDGSTFTENEIRESYNENRSLKINKRQLTKTEIACSMSHRAVYEYITKNSLKWACILEDDVTFSPELFKILDYFENSKFRNIVIKLDQPLGYLAVEKHTKHLFDDIYLNHPYWNSTSNMGYCIDFEAASNLSRIHKQIFTVSDHWDYFQKFVNVRTVNPQIIQESSLFKSDIGDRVYIDKKQPKILRRLMMRIRFLSAYFNYKR